MAVKLLPVIPAEMVLPTVDPAEPAIARPTERRLRTSSYTIYVDLPNNSHEMLLVHGYTGAFDRVSGKVATWVRSMEVKRPIRPLYGQWTPEPEIAPGTVAAPSLESIAILKRRGYLTELTLQEEEDRLAGIASTLHKQQSRFPNYIFMPTYNCNLRCFYCFQDHMRTDPAYSHLLRTMTVEMVDRIFEGIPKLEGLHDLAPVDVKRRSIGFFGGEPLLRQNRPIVEHIMRKAEALGGADFWAVSNATDLDAYSDLLGPGKIARVQITLDGTPAEHDQRRIYADGSGSYERIARNITMALESGASINIRLNIDRNNIDTLPELAQEMIAQGWPKYPNWTCYTAPIHASNEKTDRKTTFTSWGLDKELEERRELYPEMRVIDRPDDGLKDQARSIFATEGLPSHHGQFCGANSSMYIFDSFGDLYACWERTGDQRIRIGNIERDGEVNLSQFVLSAWRTRSVANNAICRQCRYALHCGGGCAVLAEGRRGSMSANFCDGYAARFRAMVAEAYLDHEAGVVMNVREGRVCDL